MIKPVVLVAVALCAVPALAQTVDPHAGHAMPAPAAAAPMDHSKMDHSKMDHGGMTMTPAPKALVRRNISPAEAALQAFSDALEVGNRDLAITRLAPGLKVVEAGIEENYADYIAGHLGADIAYQKTVKTVLLDRAVLNDSSTRVRIVSKMRMVSNRSDKPGNTVVSETAVLAKLADGWKIERLEWTSTK